LKWKEHQFRRVGAAAGWILGASHLCGRSAVCRVGHAGDKLQKIYNSEINVRISWLSDGGIHVPFGDEMNGYLAGEIVGCAGDIVPWLQDSIYPYSAHAQAIRQALSQGVTLSSRRVLNRSMKLANLFRIIVDGRPGVCPACSEAFVCGPFWRGCWCGEVKLADHVRRQLQERYSGCLCRGCLQKAAQQGAGQLD